MKDVLEIIKNIESIYESDVAFTVLKDFERVLDDLDIYVYDNWGEGELVAGPPLLADDVPQDRETFLRKDFPYVRN